jgi:hypothetical protein
MNFYSKTAAMLAATMVFAFAASALQAAPGGGQAAKVRKLEMMLMVGSLRCRFGADNFQPDYERFKDTHRGALDSAYQELKADYARQFGAKQGELALDRLSVGFANTYGEKHPWLGCGELKAITQDLASNTDRTQLVAVADYALAPARSIAFAGAR